MGRTARSNNDRPSLPKVQRVELDDTKKLWPRVVAVLALLAIGITGIVFGISRLLKVDSGWQVIETGATKENCADDFTFVYYLGKKGARAEKIAVGQAYDLAAVELYEYFSPNENFAGINNLSTVSSRANSEVKVPHELYAALEKTLSYGSRAIYAAPVYAYYEALFFASDDLSASNYDPVTSKGVADYYMSLAPYISSDEHIRLELLGDDKVILHVSDAYLAFAKSEEIDAFLDFFYLKNAFIIDCMAERLQSAGFENGYIASRDGFFRHLSKSDKVDEYVSYLYHSENGKITDQGTLTFDRPMAISTLRAYRLPSVARDGFLYEYKDGRTVTRFVGSDGFCHNALPELTSYSQTFTCADLMLLQAPVFISDTFDEAGLQALAEKGVTSAYTVNGQLKFAGK